MILKTALVQTKIAWGNKKYNLDTAEQITKETDADLIIFPEMFTTGFMTEETENYAEPMDGETIGRLRELVIRIGKAVAGSIIVKNASGTFNRFVFIKPDGTIEFYDKRHLFSYSGENNLYSAGHERIIIEYKGVRIMPLICYDLRFPVWSRNQQNYDAAIYVASWPESRIRAWDALLCARAIENQCYVLGINRVGSDPTAHYNGHSIALDYLGQELASLPENKEGVIFADLDIEALNNYRNKFRVWQDADEFIVSI